MLWRSCKGLLMGHCLTARDKKVLRTFECVWTKNARSRAQDALRETLNIAEENPLCIEAKIKCVQSKLVLSLYYFFSPFLDTVERRCKCCLALLQYSIEIKGIQTTEIFQLSYKNLHINMLTFMQKMKKLHGIVQHRIEQL